MLRILLSLLASIFILVSDAHATGLDAVVKVHLTEAQEDGLTGIVSGGTGVLITPTLVLTAKHVTQSKSGTAPLQVQGRSGQTMFGSVVWAHPVLDLAVVELERPLEGVKPASLTCAVPEVGAHVIVIGHPLTLEWMTIPWVLAGPDLSNIQGYYIGAGPIVPGMSGGPVITEQGDVIGIVSAGLLMNIAGNDYSMTPLGAFTPLALVCNKLNEVMKGQQHG